MSLLIRQVLRLMTWPLACSINLETLIRNSLNKESITTSVKAQTLQLSNVQIAIFLSIPMLSKEVNTLGKCFAKLDYFQRISRTLSSFHLNARKHFNNNLTFDFTGFPSRIVEILLDALHFEITTLPSAAQNLRDMLELIIFLLDDGKIR